MIKRPILFFLASFLLGILSCFLEQSWLVIFLFLCFLSFDLVSLRFHLYSTFLTSYDRCLLVLPLFFLIGFGTAWIHSQVPMIDSVFDASYECSISGKVTQIQSGSSYEKVTLEEVKVIGDGNAYYLSRVLLQISDSEGIRIGNVVQSVGSLKRFTEATNPGQFDEALYYQIKQYDYKFRASSIEIVSSQYSFVGELIRQVKRRLSESYATILGEEDYGIVSAMLLGEKENLSDEIKQLYQQNGIAHILAISGLHVSLLGLGLYQMLRKLKCPILLSTISTIVFLLLYGWMTGFSVSTNRAVVMLILSLCARIVGKTYDILCAMALSAILILLQNPYQLMNSGFWLSFGAIFGIVVVYGTIRPAFPTKNQFLHSLLISFSIQITTLPMILFVYYEFPPYSIFLNFIVLPLMSLVVGLSVAGGILGLISSALGTVIIGGVHYILVLFHVLCTFAETLPYSEIVLGKPSMAQIIIYYFGLLVILLFLHGGIYIEEKTKDEEGDPILELFEEEVQTERNLEELQILHKSRVAVQYANVYILEEDRRKPSRITIDDSMTWLLKMPSSVRRILMRASYSVCSYIFGLFVMIPLIFILLPGRVKGLEVIMIDVGQGDGIYFETHSGITYLMDGGSTTVSELATYRLIPFLKSRGKSKLDYVIISHMDSDHISGIEELIEDEYPIEHLIVPDTTMKDDAYIEMVEAAEQAGIKVIYFSKGDSMVNGDLQLFCLHPEQGDSPSSRNAYSTVLSLKYGEFDMLLTGDVSEEGETELIEALLEEQQAAATLDHNVGQCISTVDYDVLKVAHHGSKYTNSMELLNLINPEYALISVGANNTYGHPHEELLERLELINAKTYQTQDGGAIIIKTDGKKMTIHSFLEE